MVCGWLNAQQTDLLLCIIQCLIHCLSFLCCGHPQSIDSVFLNGPDGIRV
jgi:hypothetical protein